MPPVRNLAPGYTVIYPNRDKAENKLTKTLVVAVLLASVALMLIVTVGGWSKLQGLAAVNFAWCAVYLLFAFYVSKWARGLLPIAAALAVLLLIISMIAGLGGGGTSWFDRNHIGFAHAHALGGGSGLSADTLGTFTLLIAPVQALLIAISMYGFSQGWNVEVEVPIEEAERRGSGRPPGAPAASAA